MTTIRANGDGTMNFNTNVFCRSRHTHTHTRRRHTKRKFQASTNYGITFQVERSKICHESRIRLESRVELKFSMTQMLSSFSVCRRHCHQHLVITQCSFSTRRRTAFVTWHAHSLRLQASQSIWFLRKVQDIQPPPLTPPSSVSHTSFDVEFTSTKLRALCTASDCKPSGSATNR